MGTGLSIGSEVWLSRSEVFTGLLRGRMKCGKVLLGMVGETGRVQKKSRSFPCYGVNNKVK